MINLLNAKFVINQFREEGLIKQTGIQAIFRDIYKMNIQKNINNFKKLKLQIKKKSKKKPKKK